MSACFHCNKRAREGERPEVKFQRLRKEFFDLIRRSDKPWLIQDLLDAEARGLPVPSVKAYIPKPPKYRVVATPAEQQQEQQQQQRQQPPLPPRTPSTSSSSSPSSSSSSSSSNSPRNCFGLPTNDYKRCDMCRPNLVYIPAVGGNMTMFNEHLKKEHGKLFTIYLCLHMFLSC